MAALCKHGESLDYVRLRDFAPDGRDTDLPPLLTAVPDLPRLRWLVVDQDPGAAAPWPTRRATGTT